LQSDFCAKSLREHFTFLARLFSGFSREKCRVGRRDFSRRGPIDGPALIGFLLFLVADAGTRGYALLLDRFRDEARAFGLSFSAALDCSASAWCAARKKLAPAFVRGLVHQASDAHDARFGAAALHHGRRVFAVDGSRFNLRRSKALWRTFGGPQGGNCPQALVSTLFNLFSLAPHDLTVAPYAAPEREQLLLLLPRLRRGDLLVLDRGYPSLDVLRRLREAGIDFVVRVKIAAAYACVAKFADSGAPQAHVTLAKSDDVRGVRGVPVRIVRAQGPAKDLTVVATSLREEEFSVEEVTALYRRRWEIEEYYKVVKSDYLDARQFHALSAAGVEQEIHAAALHIGISRYLMSVAAEGHGCKAVDLSPKASLLAVAEYLVRLLVEEGAQRHLAHLLRRLFRVKEPKREGRRFPRRSFKPIHKFGSTGKRGA
jgi:hypothetical protein